MGSRRSTTSGVRAANKAGTTVPAFVPPPSKVPGERWSGFCVHAMTLRLRGASEEAVREQAGPCPVVLYNGQRVHGLPTTTDERGNVEPVKGAVNCQACGKRAPCPDDGRRQVVRCPAPWHEGSEALPRDLDEEIKEARLARAMAKGQSLKERDRLGGGERKTHCRHGHEMTAENTGPGGVCRACKREASARHKDRKEAKRAQSAVPA